MRLSKYFCFEKLVDIAFCSASARQHALEKQFMVLANPVAQKGFARKRRGSASVLANALQRE
jgi:hypothetical protein